MLGICGNFKEYVDRYHPEKSKCDEWMKPYFQTWPHRTLTDWEDWPIPGGEETFNDLWNLWQNQQLEFRISLLSHMINEISKEIQLHKGYGGGQEKEQLTKFNIKLGSNYKWKCGDEKLIYQGKMGAWHQFALIQDPSKIWCEVLDEDLNMLEEIKL